MTGGALPLPSVRNYAGSYTVLGTTHECIIERGGLDLAMWRLVVDGEFHSFHATKRDALVYCAEHVEL